ncbi:MFS transporter [Paenibacillus mucilaginosus]|uniref:Major facilitator superfamily protein n=2 Tax=Paenibacillus mucilaginosus TaxID=61624 RepID=H6NAE6_9BACL|nr:MFS transporter [Paenibacillus mucilaginosus]AEI40793.1 major facilitator superfamily MFS_1 [Paenibacillus mucilaginosus KNP414]AFC29392.1 major facilitator superfamily protein [Paenibacillus mucilaginosus 3016]MCG7211732.1 MFS transporter [Paenibacillus mucilaginosus]WDM29912.1 MFS transporter [Paenibacillus mucilaginosus]WFA18104.1 MFS transporter [Paenibacillus mucilaginosus]
MFGFSRLPQNARGCLLYEPLFLIPYSMFSTYATIYMFEMGMSETAIGWVTTLTLLVQVFSSFISGYLTDRLGRKGALLYFDLLSWTVGTLLWAVSQNIWFFIAAAVVNGFQRVPHTAFYCLLVEDTESKDRTFVFSILQFVAMLGGLFAPLGGLLVAQYGLVPGMRVMYVLACVCMTIQFVGRHFATRETQIGLRKMAETRSVSLMAGLREYKGVFRSMAGNKPLMMIFGVYILFQFQLTMKGTYLSLYLVDDLKLDSGLVSIFPAVTSMIMLLSMWLLRRQSDQGLHTVMLWGFFISLVSNLILILPLPGMMFWLILSTVLAAAGTMMTYPYLEAAVANAIDDENRASIFAMLSVLILLVVSPSGIIGGGAYRLDPSLPFLLIVLSFAASIALLVLYKRSVGREEPSSA